MTDYYSNNDRDKEVKTPRERLKRLIEEGVPPADLGLELLEAIYQLEDN